MKFEIYVTFLLCIQYALSQQTFGTLSSSALSLTSTATVATSKLSFDTLSSAGFRTTTTTANGEECSAEAKATCKNGALCVAVSKSNYYCLCTAGYAGIDCSVQVTTTTMITSTTTQSDLVPCPEPMKNICKNGAKCFIYKGEDLRCECLPLFTGVFCEINYQSTGTTITTTTEAVRESSSSGTMTSTTGTTTVTDSGITITTTTSTLNSECPAADQQNCKNGASCVYIENSFGVCICAAGFMGIDCSISVTTVSTTGTSTSTTNTNPSMTITSTTPTTTTTKSKVPCLAVINICKNDAQCFIVDNNDLVCECKPGFSGKFCDSEVQTTETTTMVTQTTTTTTDRAPCAVNVCQNNGVCEVIGGTDISCTCPTGFTGFFCENQIRSECPVNFCQNDGKCALVNGEIECTCDAGFSGFLCQIKVF